MEAAQPDTDLDAGRRPSALVTWLSRFGVFLLGAYLVGIVPGLAAMPFVVLIAATAGIPAAQSSGKPLMVCSKLVLACVSMILAWRFFNRRAFLAGWGFLGFGAAALLIGVASIVILETE